MFLKFWIRIYVENIWHNLFTTIWCNISDISAVKFKAGISKLIVFGYQMYISLQKLKKKVAEKWQYGIRQSVEAPRH